MANRSTAFGALVRRAPHLARLRLMNTLRSTKGNVTAASRLLGYLDDRMLWRHIIRLRMKTAIAELRKETGWNAVELRGGKRRDRWLRAKRRAAAQKPTS
jgi:hypothetical protein